MKKYPECEKLNIVNDDSQKIGEFLEWLEQNKIHLSSYDKFDELRPILKNRNNLLAEYFKIDLNKVEKEQRQILQELRKSA